MIPAVWQLARSTIPPHRGHESLDIYRLAEHALRTKGCGRKGVQPSDHDYWNSRQACVTQKELPELQPIHHRHPDVRHDYAWRIRFPEVFQGVKTMAASENLETLELQKLSQCVSCFIFVVYH
jgi:hypothetical protein